MKQIGLGNGFEMSSKRTRKRVFLEEMERVVPWTELVALILPHMPAGKMGRLPYPAELLLRIHFLQQWFGLSDPAMEKALYDIPLYRQFAGLDLGNSRLPDESTLLRFRHLLEAHNLVARMLLVIINTDQGSQFTATDFVEAVNAQGCRLSMDGKGAWRDNVFVERFWKSLKYERVYLHAYDSVSQARESIMEYIDWYNHQRPHSSLDRQTPHEAFTALLPAVPMAA